jgi:ribosomal-protein-alanine N-acetyltransferase
MDILQINASTGEHPDFSRSQIAEFLVTHLEQYGDKLEDILKCIDYVMDPNRGGNILVGLDNGKIAGVTILNNTGMSGYIPENILVYIAVDSAHRGKGYGKALMEKAIEVSQGSIALHVEPENPAVFLYQKLGFSSKYLEMRLTR